MAQPIYTIIAQQTTFVGEHKLICNDAVIFCGTKAECEAKLIELKSQKKSE